MEQLSDTQLQYSNIRLGQKFYNICARNSAAKRTSKRVVAQSSIFLVHGFLSEEGQILQRSLHG
jgi:hypothetical protein